MAEKFDNITGEVKSEAIIMPDGTQVYLEKSRRVGFQEIVDRISEKLSKEDAPAESEIKNTRFIGFGQSIWDEYGEEIKKMLGTRP
jgi:hypothetical protein